MSLHNRLAEMIDQHATGMSDLKAASRDYSENLEFLRAVNPFDAVYSGKDFPYAASFQRFGDALEFLDKKLTKSHSPQNRHCLYVTHMTFRPETMAVHVPNLEIIFSRFCHFASSDSHYLEVQAPNFMWTGGVIPFKKGSIVRIGEPFQASAAVRDVTFQEPQEKNTMNLLRGFSHINQDSLIVIRSQRGGGE